ncbi:hypothetical protein IMY05_001G0203500 [Salix suchowensis]|nr:hypothetical protein IMY05_001G0203500 [Salix suchowensis]
MLDVIVQVLGLNDGIPKGLNYLSFFASHCFWTKNHRCAVSVEGNPVQEQVLTFLSNGIPFVTLDLFFPQIESFLAVPYRFVTVVELEPPALFGYDFNTFSMMKSLASQMPRLLYILYIIIES